MSIILKNMQLLSEQPVAIGQAFKVRLQFERFPPQGEEHPTMVKLWCESEYAVRPGSLPVGSTDSSLETNLTLSGPKGDAFVRILGQCDEIHSLVVQVR